MDTKITVSSHETPRGLKPFYDFSIGEFLVVPSTGRLGMKLSDHAIKFFDQPVDKPLPGPRICRNVRQNMRYVTPAAIDIKVTW